MRLAVTRDVTRDQQRDIHATMSGGRYTSPANRDYMAEFFGEIIDEALARIAGAADDADADKATKRGET